MDAKRVPPLPASSHHTPCARAVRVQIAEREEIAIGRFRFQYRAAGAVIGQWR